MPDIRTAPTGLWFDQVLLHNIRRCEQGPDGWRLGRLPTAALPRLEERTRGRENRGTGCELRFRIVSGEAVIRLRTVAMTDRPANGLVEVWYGAFPADVFCSPVFVGSDGWSELRIPLPPAHLSAVAGEGTAGTGWSPELVRVRLQYDRVFELGGISGDLAAPLLADAPARRLLCYGSSITHGSSALLPSLTGMWQAADALGLDLLNLGFPGSAYLEPVIAKLIAADPTWHITTVELGINVIGRWSPEEFAVKVEAFLAILAGAERPVLVTGLYRSRHDREQPERVAAFRGIVASEVERWYGLGHVDSREFITDWRQLTADLVHPNPAGMAAIGARWAAAIRELPGFA